MYFLTNEHLDSTSLVSSHIASICSQRRSLVEAEVVLDGEGLLFYLRLTRTS